MCTCRMPCLYKGRPYPARLLPHSHQIPWVRSSCRLRIRPGLLFRELCHGRRHRRSTGAYWYVMIVNVSLITILISPLVNAVDPVSGPTYLSFREILANLRDSALDWVAWCFALPTGRVTRDVRATVLTTYPITLDDDCPAPR